MIIGCKVPFGATPPAGNYTLNGQDSWGDGWNGATVTITIDGEVAEVFGFTSGTDASTSFTLDGTQSLGLSFSGGAWDSEVTYQLEYEDPNGNAQTALSDGTSPADGPKDLNICK